MTPDVVVVEATGPLRADGVLDEADWARAAVVPPLVRFRPGPGPTDPETEVRLLADDRALWVGFTVRTAREFNGPVVPRDSIGFHDYVGILLDTFGTSQRAFEFRVNARGVQADGLFVEGEDFDDAWDEVWESGGRVTDDGYTVEIALPFRSIRYPEGPEQRWGFFVTHHIPTPTMVASWPPISLDANTTLGQAGHLVVTVPEARGIHVEVNPTLTGTWDIARGDLAADPGIGARLGLSSAVTVDAAVNPDFSQIEADADRVTTNLRYPLEYDEKRPFFLEGMDTFQTPFDVLYTRSIVDPFAGLRLTGRAGPVVFGTIGAWDEAPAASTISRDYATNTALPGWDSAIVEGARALDTVARFRWDFDGGATVGALYSGKELFTGDDVLANHAGGVDARVPFAKLYIVEGQLLYSRTDLPDAAALTGSAGALELERSSQDVDLWTGTGWVSPGFRVENGFQDEVGRSWVYGGGRFVERDWGLFRTLAPSVEAEVHLDFQGDVVFVSGGPGVEALLGTNGYVETGVFYFRERFWDVDYDRWRSIGFFAIDPTVTSNLWIEWGVGPQPHYAAATEAERYLGFGWYGEVGATAAIAARLRLDAEVAGDQFRRSAAGDVVYQTVISRLKANLNLTRALSVRLIEEWNTRDATLDSSLLVSLVRDYGTAAYLGYSEQYALASATWTERTVFAKVGWLWRP